MPPLWKGVGQQDSGGSVVKFLPATRFLADRFPVSAFLFFFFFNMEFLIYLTKISEREI